MSSLREAMLQFFAVGWSIGLVMGGALILLVQHLPDIFRRRR